MPPAGVPELDPAFLLPAAGPTTFTRGVTCLRQHAVVAMHWDDAQHTLHGTVQGRPGQYYTTTALFNPADGKPLQFEQAYCTCLASLNCKHAVALVLAAVQAWQRQGSSGPAPVPDPPSRMGPPPWEHSLQALLEPPPPAAARLEHFGAAVAVELTLSGDPDQLPFPGCPGSSLRLLARLRQRGRHGWPGGTLNWNQLSYLPHGRFDRQVQLLQEIYAVYQSRRSQPGYHSYDGDSVELSGFEARQLWPLLDEAAAIGLQLVRGGQRGPLENYRSAEFCLDATRPGPDGPLVIAPVIRIDGDQADVALIRFIGAEGHGIIYADRADAQRSSDPADWRFHLAKLAQPVLPPLQQMAQTGQRLEIPVTELDRFWEGYYLRLRRAATVLSLDESFPLPAVSGPALLLRVVYQGGHRLDLGWEWAYQVGEATLRAALGPGTAGAGYRDLAAERAIVASLQLPVGRFGLLRTDPVSDEPQPSLAPQVQLRGLDTMRFCTELLPLLGDHPGITVEITGELPDYREAGDSLLIGVSTDEVAGDPDWFDLGLTISVEGQEVPFADVFVALSRDQPYLLLANGAYFSLQKPELQALALLIEEARSLQDIPGSLRISRFQAGLWEELAGLGVVSHQARSWQEQVGGLLSATGLAAEPSVGTPPPVALQAVLRPYQLDGFQWLAFLWQHRLGGILADDMGLGKTVQSLALICHARQAEPASPPFLIVAPTSVVPNWASEAARFAPDLTVVAISETAARRGRPLSELAAGADAVVTSYTLLRLDFAEYSAQPWPGLILDEAQYTKNHQSKIYQCARKLAAPVKVAITGTPMENNLMELWSLLSITAPGLFPDPGRFREYYARPIERDGQAELLAQLRRRIRPLVKRRTKEQVAADLPAKQVQVLDVDLHPRHRKVYETYLQRERQKVLHLLDDLDANRFVILRSLTLLRQLSLHAGLVDDAYLELPCSKIDMLLEQLRDVTGGGHRALVFSQFTGFLRKVRERLDAAGIEYCYLDGKTRDRAAEVRRFREGTAPAFLISLKAGGFGLNLTEADYCFLLDPWWNPATETQAVDRTHRIGQTRQVMVYRLIAAATIEEKVMALQARKAELFTSVLDNGDVFSGRLDADDIRTLLA